jgi:hypothetical protein
MSPRLWVVSLVPLFAAATAHAQAPGEWEPPPYYGPAVVEPPPAPPLPGRWSIGLSAGNTVFGTESSDETVDFAGGSLALRYRPWRKVELELTLGGGRQTIDGEDGDLAMATGTLAARYRFNQRDKWNWWLLFGVGATTIARHDASDDEIDAAQRPHVAVGIGLEYRFTNLALQIEGRAIGLGQTEAEMEAYDRGEYTPESIAGGTVTFGASYYFGR